MMQKRGFKEKVKDFFIRLHQSKQGQLFIIAAVILILVLFTLTIQYNTIREFVALEDFEQTSENYASEYPKVYNLALYEGKVPEEEVEKFTKEFVEEIRKRDPEYGLFYVFHDTAGNVHILNTLNKKVLNIKAVQEGKKASEFEFNLVSNNAASQGEICITGGICGSASAPLSYYGKEYRNEKVITDVDMLILKMGDTELLISLKSDDPNTPTFSNYIYQTSSSEIQVDEESAEEFVSVSISQFN